MSQIIDESVGFLPAGHESDLLAELGDVFDPFFDRIEDVSFGQEEESRISALAGPLVRRERPSSAALGRPPTPSIVTIQEMEGARAAPVAEEEKPPRKDTATMTIDQPIVALPTGWSLRRLAKVAGRNVGLTIGEMEERKFGPIADLPDEQQHSLEVLLPFAAAVHQAAMRRIRDGVREAVDCLR